MLIDLTGDDDVKVVAGGTECPICMHSWPGGVHYSCCAQFCCLTCFRRMHCGASARTLDGCPFCRKDVAADMDLLQLHWRCGDGSRGSLWVYPGDPLDRLCALLPLAPGWPTASMMRVGAVQCERSQQVLLLDATPLYMSALAHGDRVNVLFEYHGMLMF